MEKKNIADEKGQVERRAYIDCKLQFEGMKCKQTIKFDYIS